MSDEKFYRIPQPIHPFINPLPTPSTSPNDPDSQICVMFSRNWLPLILGAIKLFQYDDIWEFPTEQLKNDGQTLIRQFMTPFLCETGASNVEIRAVDVGEGCQQYQWRIDGGVWIDIGVPVCSGQDGTDGRSPEFQLVPAGELCQTIQWRLVGDTEWIDLGQVCNGEPGEQGIPGEDCDCEQVVPPNPTEPSDGLRCSIAINLTRELRNLWDKSYDDEGGFISQYAGGLISGAGLLALLIPGVNLAVAGATVLVGVIAQIGQLASNGESNAFDDPAEERYRCMLYCILGDDNTITQEILNAWAEEIRTDELNPLAYLIADLVDNLPLDHWQWFAWASSEVDPAACDCPECQCENLILGAAREIPLYSELVSEIGKNYRITVSGVVDFSAGTSFIDYDALYFRDSEGNWVTPAVYATEHSSHGGFNIDGSRPPVQAWREDAIYEFIYAGTGDPFKFFSADDVGGYFNNDGEWHIEICEVDE